MMIHPWDAALDDEEWRTWLTESGRFAVLAVNNLDPAQAPLVVPTHATLAEDELLLHLARPNPLWPHLEAATEVSVTFTGDDAFIPGYWRHKGGPPENGVPTSYYSAVQFICRPHIIDDPQAKAELLTAQMLDFQPEGRHAPLAVDAPPYGRMLSGIRGVRLHVLRVEAKFKYDDEQALALRDEVSAALDRRGDGGVAAQQRRRRHRVGRWRP